MSGSSSIAQIIFYYGRNTFRKKVILIVRLIDYKEVRDLLKRGIKYGEGGISHTRSRHSGVTYYLTESPRNMRILEKYRNSLIVK